MRHRLGLCVAVTVCVVGGCFLQLFFLPWEGSTICGTTDHATYADFIDVLVLCCVVALACACCAAVVILLPMLCCAPFLANFLSCLRRVQGTDDAAVAHRNRYPLHPGGEQQVFESQSFPRGCARRVERHQAACEGPRSQQNRRHGKNVSQGSCVQSPAVLLLMLMLLLLCRCC